MLQIVIPAYNEERRLPRTLRELRRHVTARRHVLGQVEIVVVDNASDDRTAAVARAADSAALPVRVVRCAVPGKGAAVRTGLLATRADLVCFMDADGATGLSALEDGRRRLLLGADAVIGSRGLPDSVTSVRHCRTRTAGAAWYRRFAGRLVPGVVDTQCGFKLMRGDLARRVATRLRTDGFSFDVELLVRLRAMGARIEEMPVTWVDVPGSTFTPVRHGAGAFAELAVIAWRTRGLAPVTTLPSAAPSAVTSATPTPAAPTGGLSVDAGGTVVAGALP